VRSGKVLVRVRGVPFATVDRPSLVLLPMPCPHTLIALDPDGADLVCASIELGDSIGSPLAKAFPEVLILRIDEMTTIAATLELLFSEAFGERYGRNAALDRLVEYLLIQILRHAIDSGVLTSGVFAAMSDPRLARALHAMHERPAQSWTLENLAETAGMSRARFAVNFRRSTGLTPMTYLTRWRMSIAQALLKQGKPIKQVAHAIGYRSPAALTRIFTRCVGLPPSEWIRATSRTSSS
jgi:AraC-like DNA-binding protein